MLTGLRAACTCSSTALVAGRVSRRAATSSSSCILRFPSATLSATAAPPAAVACARAFSSPSPRKRGKGGKQKNAKQQQQRADKAAVDPNWETVVGIEVHAQVLSASKLFSGASTEFGSLQNSQVALVDAALPGTLPVLNAECVDQAIRTGIALSGTVNSTSRFVRKHYFYCDMPQGYQITQQVGVEGVVYGGWCLLLVLLFR